MAPSPQIRSDIPPNPRPDPRPSDRDVVVVKRAWANDPATPAISGTYYA